jgi:AAA-like domain
MRPPLSFVYGNCVFAAGLDDGWAAFALPTSSYEWLSEEQKHVRFQALAAALATIDADVQILRVSRRHDPAVYAHEMSAAVRSANARRYVDEHARHMAALQTWCPVVFLLVSLHEPQRDVSAYVSRVAERHPRHWLATFRALAGARNRRMLSTSELERNWRRAEHVRARLADFLQARPVRGVELQWLVRRAFCRGLGEPSVDGLHQPRALVFERGGEGRLAPLEGDVLRWIDSYVEQRGRTLRVESELGTSWQAQLVVGALPEQAPFPGERVELMFAPIESLPFGVDLALCARYLPNERALRITRRRIQDADQIVRAEAEGEQGVSDQGEQRTRDARDLLGYLQAASRPPLLRATLTLSIGARAEDELEERVELCRRAYGEVHLHRPIGDQLELFVQHLPAQRTRVAGYDDTLTVEQVAAMMPTAAHSAGSNNGFYLGHTLSGSSQPVRFNLSEGSERDRNAAILSVGALGSGKTTLDQKLKYEGFLLGARVIDCDPKGDHRFHLLEDVAPHTECITIRPDRSLRGVLDPLRIAPAHIRQDAAVSFLLDLLPGSAQPSWQAAVVEAVDRVIQRADRPTCSEVVHALATGEETARDVARTLAVYAQSGLTQLGFCDPAVRLPEVGRQQVTYLPIRDLPSTQSGVPRSEYSQAERVGEQIVRLIAMFAMQLMAAERERLKLFSFDEGWRLLGDPVGRELLVSLQRMGRSELAVPIISTQQVTDTLLGERESLQNLLGATFVFGMRSDAEARRALELLGLDATDAGLRHFLLGLDRGRCLFRDHHGRIEALQVEIVVPELLRAFSTTPRRSS